MDDEAINRAILANGFSDSYKILEAGNGREGLELLNSHRDISAVLLDLIMPEMDGFGVLREMNASRAINRIPVFIITAEGNREALMDAYNFGAADVISKPFMMNFLRCRINNVIELYAHRDELEVLANEQYRKLNSVNTKMIETLAALVEFRDCETGDHIRRICDFTEMFLRALCSLYPEYWMPDSEIRKIVTAAVLHDVGKIAIPDSILKKPGKLTPEEFEIMKQHTVKGCDMLKKIPEIMDKDIYSYCYDICRHHHERWDGRGYPDKLKGNEISIWAQVVAIADVYDALITTRVYKPAYSHERAIEMINGGECGVFNPKVLHAFNMSLS